MHPSKFQSFAEGVTIRFWLFVSSMLLGRTGKRGCKDRTVLQGRKIRKPRQVLRTRRASLTIEKYSSWM